METLFFEGFTQIKEHLTQIRTYIKSCPGSHSTLSADANW